MKLNEIVKEINRRFSIDITTSIVINDILNDENVGLLIQEETVHEATDFSPENVEKIVEYYKEKSHQSSPEFENAPSNNSDEQHILTIRIDDNTEQKNVTIQPADTPYLFGRGNEVAQFLGDPTVSRKHCSIDWKDNQFLIRDCDSRVGTYLNGVSIQSNPLKDGDVLSIGKFKLFIQIDTSIQSRPKVDEEKYDETELDDDSSKTRYVKDPNRYARDSFQQSLPESFDLSTGKQSFVLGRKKDCDICLDDLLVSRIHAKIDRQNDIYHLFDHNSTNGTYVNGRLIKRKTRIKLNDQINIGPFQLIFTGKYLITKTQKKGARIAVRNLSKEVTDRKTNKPLLLLNDITLTIENGEFIGLLGQSGCGKSTFMDAINGRRHGTEGSIYYDDTHLYEQFVTVKDKIGYVPQNVIFHENLPLVDALKYASRLRLSSDINETELDKNINRVLTTVKLLDRKDTVIRDLSGGQKKKVAIAMELLSKPQILFLDEVTSGLDLGSERQMMRLFRDLSHEEITVVCITHFVDSLDICDQVAYFVKGRLAFFGSPFEMKDYFQIDRISGIYDRNDEDNAKQCEMEFRVSNYYKKNVESKNSPDEKFKLDAYDFSNHANKMTLDDIKDSFQKIKKKFFQPIFTNPKQMMDLVNQPSAFARQLKLLFRRYFQLIVQDKNNMPILLLPAPLIAILLCLVTSSLEDNDPHKQSVLCFGAVLTVFFLSLFSSIREIVKEDLIYRHERFISLQLFPYIISKVIVLFGIGVIQTVLVYFIISQFGDFESDNWIRQIMVLLSTSLAGTMLGLTISAWATSSDLAVNGMIAVVIPQVLFSGALVSEFSSASEFIAKYFIVSYWSFHAMIELLPQGENWIQYTIPIILFIALYFFLVLYFMAYKDGANVFQRILNHIKENN